MIKKQAKFLILFLLLPIVTQAQLTTLIGKTANNLAADVTDLQTQLNAAFFDNFGSNDALLRDAILSRGINAVDYSSLEAALNAAVTDTNFVIVASPGTVSDIYTIPSHAGLYIAGGSDARITLDPGVTLYINGFFWAPPNQKVFFGDGNVVFGPGTVSRVYPEWWGARADSTGDSGPAFKAAYTAVPNGAVIELLAGGRTLHAAKGYIINTTVRIPSDKNTVLQGNGTTIYSSASDTVFLFNNGSQTSIPSFGVSPGNAQPRHLMASLRFKRISGYQGNGTAIALINTTGASFHNIDVYSYNNAFVFNNQSDGWCENNDLFDCRISAADTAILYKVTLAGNNSFATNSLHKVTITNFDSSHVIRPGNGQAVGIYTSAGSNIYRNVWDQVVVFVKDSVTAVHIGGQAENLTGNAHFEIIGSTNRIRSRGFHFGASSQNLMFNLHMDVTGRRYFDDFFFNQSASSFGPLGIHTIVQDQSSNASHGISMLVDSSKFSDLFSILRQERLGNFTVTPGDTAHWLFANMHSGERGRLTIRGWRNHPIVMRSMNDGTYDDGNGLLPVKLLDVGVNRSLTNAGVSTDTSEVDVRNTTYLLFGSGTSAIDQLTAFKGGIAGQYLQVHFLDDSTTVVNLSGASGSGRIFLRDNANFRTVAGLRMGFICESESGGVFWRERWREYPESYNSLALLYMSNTTTATTVANTATWIKTTGFTLDTSPASQGITAVADSFTVTAAGNFKITANVVLNGETATEVNWKMVIAKNSTATTKAQGAVSTTNATIRATMSLVGFYAGAIGDRFSLLIQNLTNADDFTVRQAQFTIERIN